MNVLASPKVFVIILHWNKQKEILECLESVLKIDYANYEVVVVDNGSDNNSYEVIQKNYQDVHLMRNRNNLGFAGGNNVGMRYAMEQKADYVWLLNDDTIVEPDVLSKMVKISEHGKNIGMVSPIIYYYDHPNSVQYAGSYIDWETLSVKEYADADITNSAIVKMFQTGQDVCLWGTSLLIKREVIEKVGFLDDRYFAYWEDTEYSIRTLKKGFRNMVCNRGKIYHKTNRDILKQCGHQEYYYYYMFRNRALLIKEYSQGVMNLLNCERIFLADILNAIGSCWRNGNIKNLDAILLGTSHGFKGITGPMQQTDGMPRLLKTFFKAMAKSHPFFLSAMIRLDFKKMKEMIKARAGVNSVS